MGGCLPRGMPRLMPESLQCCHSALAGVPVWVSVRRVQSRDGSSHAELAERAYL